MTSCNSSTGSSTKMPLLTVLLVSLSLISTVQSHGYMATPRSRQQYATEENNWEDNTPGEPFKENCPACSNRKDAGGVCGKTSEAKNYDDYKDVNGNPMPWKSQEFYREGQEITVDGTLTANHAGHIEVYACADHANPTQACFDANPLTMVKDDINGGPNDPDYPVRGYVSNSMDFSFTYRLPQGVVGDKVLIQWFYVTANSCFPHGYKTGPIGDILEEKKWRRAIGMAECPPPYDDYGTTLPERFWNCAEVSIAPGGPTGSPRPSPTPKTTPPAPGPTPLTPTPDGQGYCCWDNCCISPRPDPASPWCDESEDRCMNGCSGMQYCKSEPIDPIADVTVEFGFNDNVQACKGDIVEVVWQMFHNIQETESSECDSADIGSQIEDYLNSGEKRLYENDELTAEPGETRYFKCSSHCGTDVNRFEVSCPLPPVDAIVEFGFNDSVEACTGDSVRVVWKGNHNIQETESSDCNSANVGQPIEDFLGKNKKRTYTNDELTAAPGERRFFKCSNHCGADKNRFEVYCPAGPPQLASTTRYWDCAGGACGCAYLPSHLGGDPNSPAHCYSNAMFDAPNGNKYGAKFYGTAAVSPKLFGDGTWIGEGCGKCWKVTGDSNTPKYNGVTTTLVLKGTNICPPENDYCAHGRVHFDISAPGFDVTEFSHAQDCKNLEPEEEEGFEACGRWLIDNADADVGCDCSQFKNAVLRKGCENFLSLYWDNASVTYDEVDCPVELSRLNCWEDNGNDYPPFLTIPETCASNEETDPPVCADPNELNIIVETKGDSNSKKHKNKWSLEVFENNAWTKVTNKPIAIKPDKKLVWPTKKMGDKCFNKDSCFMLTLRDKNGDGMVKGGEAKYKVTFGGKVVEGTFDEGKEWKEMINCACS